MKMQITKQLIAGMLMIGTIGLLRSQSLFALPVSQAQPNLSKNFVVLFRGSWTGTFRTVGSQGQMLVFIDPSGKLYESLKSNNGDNFTQISGYHLGDTFHMIFTPPPSSLNQFGSSSPDTVDASAKWEQEVRRFIISAPTRTEVTRSYIRLSEYPSNKTISLLVSANVPLQV